MENAKLNAPATLVMTATIKPPDNCPALARRDPLVRLNDYLEAFRFYLRIPDDLLWRIVFIDNSGSDLSAFEKEVNASSSKKEIHLIDFEGNDHPPHFGKGYGEFRLLDHGLGQVELAPDDVLWKVTGRLRINNLADLIATAPRPYEVYCDLRAVPLIKDRLGGNHWMDLRVFSITAGAYDQLFRDRYRFLRVRYGRAPEQHLYKVVQRARRDFHVVPRFRLQPKMLGHNGHSDRDYQGKDYLRKERVRRVARRVMPWLWL